MNEMQNPPLNDLFDQAKELLRIFARREQEIAAGKGYDLETVLAEADTLLAEEPVLKT